MLAIEENRRHRFRRVRLLPPILQIGALYVAQIDPMFRHELRIAIAVPGEHQAIGEKLQTLDQVRRPAAIQVTGGGLKNIERSVACLRHLRVDFARAADEEKSLATLAAALPQKFNR